MNIKAYIESGVIESYVLGMADAQEVAQIEELKLQYSEIKLAIEDFENAIEKAAFTSTIAPKSSIKENLLIELKNEFIHKEVLVPIPEPFKATQSKVIPINREIPAKNIKWIKYIAAASVVLLMGSATLNMYFYSKYQEIHTKYASLLNEKNIFTKNNQLYEAKLKTLYNNIQIISNPKFTKIPLAGIKGKENNLATIFWDNASKDVYLIANKLPEAPTSKQYQLWAIVDGKPVNAGLLNNCEGLCRLKNIPKAQAFAITLENEGGSQNPTLTQMYVFGKV